MSQNKHIVNDPRNLANESLAGLARVNSKIKVDATHRVVYAANIPQDRVALVSNLLYLITTYSILTISSTRSQVVVQVMK